MTLSLSRFLDSTMTSWKEDKFTAGLDKAHASAAPPDKMQAVVNDEVEAGFHPHLPKAELCCRNHRVSGRRQVEFADPLRLQWRMRVSTGCGFRSMKSPKETPYRLWGFVLLGGKLLRNLL